MQNVPYASAVGSIMYDVRCTRPDVAFANAKDMFLVYGENPEAELRVDCYCDAGFETDRDDTKSQTGYVFILNGGAVIEQVAAQSGMDSKMAELLSFKHDQNFELIAIAMLDSETAARDDTNSMTGYVFVLNGGAVDWKSSKQSTTAMSATESEYIAASEAAMRSL
ncbi:hypothetical protein Tco_1229413 [Tanacetum coccineum]